MISRTLAAVLGAATLLASPAASGAEGLDTSFEAWLATHPRAAQSRYGTPEEVYRFRVRLEGYFEAADAYPRTARVVDRIRAASALRRSLAAATVPSETDLRAAYARQADRLHQPRRWQLGNIFLGGGPGTQRRREAAAILLELRNQVLAGAPFETLARAHSESQTRHRGGRMGNVALDQLRPVMRAAVAALDTGGVSEVVETPEGLHLLYCFKVHSQIDSFETAREVLEPRVSNARAREAAEHLLAALRRRHPVTRATLAAVASEDDTPVLAWPGEGPQSVDRAEYRAWLRYSGRAGEVSELDDTSHAKFLDELIDERLLAAKADERGLTLDAGFQRDLGWELWDLRADLVLSGLTAQRVRSEPPAGELDALFETMRPRLQRRPQQRLRLLTVAIDQALTRDEYERLTRLVEQARRGQISLREVAERLDDLAQLHEYDWASDREVWLLGLNVEKALEQMVPGDVSELVQEGKQLHVIELVDERPAQPLTVAEAEERVIAMWHALERRRAREAVRSELTGPTSGEDR